MSNLIDETIEHYEYMITSAEDYVDYMRTEDGWVEENTYTSRLRSIHVNRQAVLFAEREGF